MASSWILLFGLLLPVLAFPALKDVDSCASVPPALWCLLGEDLEKECGFEELCHRYIKTSANHPVCITLLYESLCPASQFYITQTIPNLLESFGDDGRFIEFELVPYGNAQLNNGTITCQHGEDECTYNRWQSCILAHAGNTALKTVICLENELKNNPSTAFSDDLAKCYSSLGIDQDTQDAIAKCNSTDEGDQLQLQAAQRTIGVKPDRHEVVPWILINDVSVKKVQQVAFDPTKEICFWYTGDIVPQPCVQKSKH